ncbi:hypothetical protein [Celeribacter indicus]|nr:hypothetical protein [Celeribacter indicus]
MQLALGLFLVTVTLWAAYSLLSVLIPLRPFSSRGKAARSFGLSVLAILATGIALGLAVSSPQAAGGAGPEPRPARTAAAETADDPPPPCGGGAPGDVVAVTGSHELRAAPGADAPRIRNEKASRALGTDHFHRIDSSTTVRRLCRQDEWTEVRIVTPDWLSDVGGWVPTAALRQIGRTEDDDRLYVEEDFHWDTDTAPFKPQVVTVVNRIARENRNCREIDTASVAKSPSRSGPGDPVFFVTCGSGMEAFNIWFRPSDADGAEGFAAKAPLAKGAAVAACEAAARRAAVHPSTVDFSRILDLAYIPHASGRARVVSTFTARTALNLELTYRIDCLFDGPELIETHIAERLE